jgi:hypothetical protein
LNANTPLAFTNTNSTRGGNPSYSFDYAENRASGATLGTVGAAGGSLNRVFSITAGNGNGWFAINCATGAITLTAAGAASLANNFEQVANVHRLTVQISDGTARTWNAVALNETDVDDTAPVLAEQSLSYPENQSANTALGTVTASDAVGGTRYRFNTNGTQVSPDKYFAIENSGVISITAAGVATGIAANDFERTPPATGLPPPTSR